MSRMALKSSSIVFINGTPLADNVFQSHIISYLKTLKESGTDVSLLSITEDSDSKSEVCESNRASIRALLGNKAIFVKQPPANRGFNPMLKALKPALEKIRIEKSPQLFHTNSYLTGYLTLRILNKRRREKMLVDFKGILPQECLYYDPCNLPLRIARYLISIKMEKYICRHADGLTVVSNAFKEWVVRKRGFAPQKIWVAPSCVDETVFKIDWAAREEIRKTLGWGDAPVIVYNGSLRKWQLPERMFELFSAIYKKNKDVRFLFLTDDLDGARRFMQNTATQKENFHLKSVRGANLARYLSTGDAGILLRKKDIVNQVASPTKFGEYLRCGLGVIATDGIGDYSRIIREKNFGIVIPSRLDKANLEEAARWFLNHLGELRKGAEARSYWAGAELGWAKNIQTLQQAYEALITEKP